MLSAVCQLLYSSGVEPAASSPSPSLRFRLLNCFDVELIQDVGLVICFKGDRADRANSDCVSGRRPEDRADRANSDCVSGRGPEDRADRANCE